MSVFLAVPESYWVASNRLAFAIRDRYPVSPGHTLIITRRVVADWFHATAAEQMAVLELMSVVKKQIEQEFMPNLLLNARYQYLVLYTVGADKLRAGAEDVTAAMADGALRQWPPC